MMYLFVVLTILMIFFMLWLELSRSNLAQGLRPPWNKFKMSVIFFVWPEKDGSFGKDDKLGPYR